MIFELPEIIKLYAGSKNSINELKNYVIEAIEADKKYNISDMKLLCNIRLNKLKVKQNHTSECTIAIISVIVSIFAFIIGFITTMVFDSISLACGSSLDNGDIKYL